MEFAFTPIDTLTYSAAKKLILKNFNAKTRPLETAMAQLKTICLDQAEDELHRILLCAFVALDVTRSDIKEPNTIKNLLEKSTRVIKAIDTAFNRGTEATRNDVSLILQKIQACIACIAGPEGSIEQAYTKLGFAEFFEFSDKLLPGLTDLPLGSFLAQRPNVIVESPGTKLGTMLSTAGTAATAPQLQRPSTIGQDDDLYS